MDTAPNPLFEAFGQFKELCFDDLTAELPVVQDYLKSFKLELCATEGYLAVRDFLRRHCDKEATFACYRTHSERLLLWSILVAEKPVFELKKEDAEAFIEFCLSPPPSWIGQVTKSRFIRLGGRRKLESDTYLVNGDWRPFCVSVPTTKPAAPEDRVLRNVGGAIVYKVAHNSIGTVVRVCTSFLNHLVDQGLMSGRPFNVAVQSSKYRQRLTPKCGKATLTVSVRLSHLA